MDRVLGGSPAGFKLEKPLVFRFGPAEVKALVSIPSVPFDGFPHHEIVCPEALVSPVGGPVLVKGLLPEVEKDGAGNVFPLMGCKHNEPKIFRYHLLIKILKKNVGLGRQPVFSSCQAIETAEFLYGFEGVEGPRLHPFPVGPLDASPCGILKTIEDLFFVLIEVNHVTKVRNGRL